MSQANEPVETDDEELSVPRKVLRTVTPYYRGHESSDVGGWAMFLALLVLVVPLLPFIVLVWVISKGFEALSGRGDETA